MLAGFVVGFSVKRAVRMGTGDAGADEDTGEWGRLASLTARVYQALKQRVLRCELLPGQDVFEGRLAREFGTSKTPVREALNMLCQEGLVQVLPRRGYLIAPITIKDVQDIFDLRLTLEGMAAERAAERVDRQQLAGLQELVEARYVFGDRHTYSRFLASNRHFHVAVAEASANPRLASMVDRLLSEMERVLHLGLDLADSAEEMAREHAELVVALARGDAALAREVAVQQIEQSRRRVLAALVAAPGSIVRIS